ncbi:MAG: hypothetical protein GKR88_04330 [Flavobacteriaceae bacterium]|nr:MAG: hypothetical protein GKR88_04330 [Flavobacteriaceae bacterium]
MITTEFPYKDVQTYLNATGVLETGTAEEITQARKVFRKLYLQQYQKRRYNKTHINISISFSKKEKEVMQKLAIENGKKLARFLKDIALDYAKDSAGNVKAPTNTKNFIEIKRLLSLSYDIVEMLHFENSYSELQQSYEELLHLFKQLETLLEPIK